MKESELMQRSISRVAQGQPMHVRITVDAMDMAQLEYLGQSVIRLYFRWGNGALAHVYYADPSKSSRQVAIDAWDDLQRMGLHSKADLLTLCYE